MQDEIRLLDVVALTQDLRERGLVRGQVGTVVEMLGQDTYEVEFSDNTGRTFAELALRADQLIVLYYEPALDKTITKFVGRGDDIVASGYPKYEKKKVWINGRQGFEGVPEKVWEFPIGGYQVCHKWLKDRRGRTLLVEDKTHYAKIVVALKETIRLMKEIDEVIEKHGGYPIQ